MDDEPSPWQEILDERFTGALLADGFEDAIIGLGSRFTYPVAVYDRRKCIKILIARDGMTPEEAEEYFGVNVEGAYVGEHTPIFLDVRWGDDCVVVSGPPQ